MCFGIFDTQVQSELKQRSTQGASAPAMSPDFMRRLVLGGFGDFGSRVREAGLGTSVKPKSLGTPITTLAKDITRQS